MQRTLSLSKKSSFCLISLRSELQRSRLRERTPKAVFIDGTHIKANATTKKQVKVHIPAASKYYAKGLVEEVNADREAHGKRPFDDKDEPPASSKTRRDNTSKKKLARRKKEEEEAHREAERDRSGQRLVCSKGRPQAAAYEAHTACDKHGFILETVVTPGNVRDSVAFDEVYDRVTAAFPEAEIIVADSAYKTPHICKKYLMMAGFYPQPISVPRP